MILVVGERIHQKNLQQMPDRQLRYEAMWRGPDTRLRCILTFPAMVLVPTWGNRLAMLGENPSAFS